MFTAQHFEKATEYEGLLGSAHSSDEASEFRELMQSYVAPAENCLPWRAALTQFLRDRKDDEQKTNRMSGTFGGGRRI
jgi:hypothetical protein